MHLLQNSIIIKVVDKSSLGENGFKVSVTGNEVASTPLKVLLDNLEADASTSNDIFIQIIYS